MHKDRTYKPDSAESTTLGEVLDPLMLSISARVLVNGTEKVRHDVLKLLMNRLSTNELVGFLDGPFRRSANEKDFPKEKIDAAINFVKTQCTEAMRQMKQGILFT